MLLWICDVLALLVICGWMGITVRSVSVCVVGCGCYAVVCGLLILLCWLLCGLVLAVVLIAAC